MAVLPKFRRFHFTLKDRFASLVSEKLFQNFTYTVRHGLIKGMRRKGGLGFLPVSLARSPHNAAEEAFLGALQLKDKVVYDVGAFQGLMTLFFASKAKKVVTYEPNPVSFRRVQENVALNGLDNVLCLNRAVGDWQGKLTLVYDPRMPGAATGDPTISAQITDTIDEVSSVEVPLVRLDDDITTNGLPQPDFIKIDIEGMELAALEGMRQTLADRHPDLYIEMHGATDLEKKQKAGEIIQFLLANRYFNIRHIETGTRITADNYSVAQVGHIYCTAVA
jgi:FkbM family methyltransferase